LASGTDALAQTLQELEVHEGLVGGNQQLVDFQGGVARLVLDSEPVDFRPAFDIWIIAYYELPVGRQNELEILLFWRSLRFGLIDFVP
jgi:hypothetical protein